MPKSLPSHASPLVLAAAALDEELRNYDSLAKDVSGSPITSGKALERAKGLVQESVSRSEIIQEKLRGLVAQIEGARLRQVDSLNTLLEAARSVQARTEQYDALLGRFAALGEAAHRVKALAEEFTERRNAGVSEAAVLQGIGEIQVHMAGVVAEAEALSALAANQDWPDIARQADAVRQQLLAAKNKLTVVQRAAAKRAPS
jgi:hypothetical protein